MSVESYKLERDIQASIQKQVFETKEKVMKMALQEFELSLRDLLGRTAINIANYFTVERMGQNLVITVKLAAEEKQP